MRCLITGLRTSYYALTNSNKILDNDKFFGDILKEGHSFNEMVEHISSVMIQYKNEENIFVPLYVEGNDLNKLKSSFINLKLSPITDGPSEYLMVSFGDSEVAASFNMYLSESNTVYFSFDKLQYYKVEEINLNEIFADILKEKPQT